MSANAPQGQGLKRTDIWESGTSVHPDAGIGCPPPKQPTPAAEKRLRMVSIALIALGLIDIICVLAAGKHGSEARSVVVSQVSDAEPDRVRERRGAAAMRGASDDRA